MFKFKHIFDLHPDVTVQFNVICKDSIVVKFFDKFTFCPLKQRWKIVPMLTVGNLYGVDNKKISENKIVVIPIWYKNQDKINIKGNDSKLTNFMITIWKLCKI